MNNSSTRAELLRQFERALAKLRYELSNNLGQIDPLDRDKLSQLLLVFNQRLIVFQHDFLQYLERARGESISSRVEEFVISTPSCDKIPELASAILAGGAGAFLVHLLPVATSGFLWWTTTVTAAAATGAALGLPAGVVTAGVGVAAGAGAGIVVSLLMKSKRRESVRLAIMNKFDKEVAPKLLEWASNHINR